MDTVDPSGKVVLGGTCIDSRTFVLTSCALSIFMDLIIIPIPSIMVWNLQMSRRTKVLVVIVMSLGWIATGVSVGRFIVYYYRFAPTNTDRTWDIGIAISIAEPAVHIMTACAPATKCLFRYLFPFWGSQRNSQRNTTYYKEPNTADHMSGMRKSGSRVSRGLGAFRFGISEPGDEDFVMETRGAGRNNIEDMKTESAFDLKPLESNDDMTEEEARRASCSNTTHTAASEATKAEPKHCLGLAR